MTGAERQSTVGGAGYLALVERARVANLARTAELEQALDVLVAPTAGVAGDVSRQAAGVAHQVLGSAGTFGFPTASLLAARLESFFRDVPSDPGVHEAARVWLRDLRGILEGQPHFED